MSQDTDFQIPNGTGQAVRLDLQTAILALASLSSGSQSGLGTTQPCQLFADTENGLLKIRDTSGNAAAAQATFHTIGSLNTANLGLLPRSGGTMTGVITGSTGSAAAPSINFGDSSTGIFKQGTNVLGVTGAGNLSFTFSNISFNLRDQRPARFFDSDSSNYIEIKAPSTVSSSNKTLTLPDETGTLLTDQTTSLAVTTVTTTNTRTTNIQDSSGNNSTTPAQIDNGRAKAWVNFDGRDGTLTDSDQSGVNSKFPSGLKVIKRTFPTGSTQANKNYYEIQIPAAVFKDANFVVTGSSGGLYNTSDGGIYLLPETADNNNGINSSKSSTRVSIGVVAPSGAFTTAPVINLMLFGESPD